ncbi:MAG: hypothetical protein ACETVN_01435 [Asgard group archaeon]
MTVGDVEVINMKTKFRAYTSWFRLCEEDFLLGVGGKLATLWFDEIILQVPGEDIILKLSERVAADQDWSSSTLKEIRRIWISVEKCIPNYQFLFEPLKSEHPSLVDTTLQVMFKKLIKSSDYPADFPYHLFLRDVAWTSHGVIEAVNVWLVLNQKNPCSFFPASWENLVLQELFSRVTKKKPFDIFSEIMVHKIPDLNSYSFDEIIELRRHPFFNEFRQKMVELYDKLNSGESQNVQELVDEISRKDMEEMVRLFRPNPLKTVIKAIASNVPLPIPINPVSILFSAGDVKTELKISKKYGWLYFLLDLTSGD